MPVLREHLLELAWLPRFPMGEETTNDCVFVCTHMHVPTACCYEWIELDLAPPPLMLTF